MSPLSGKSCSSKRARWEFAGEFAKLDDLAQAAALAQMQALPEAIDGQLATVGG